ncbi:MAG TPA: SNF2-related protein [Acidimicrobiales bacterium]|jgi:SNF2 family DNA or RNA helicase|nr:SNF2-related protein [Acidimicrobiales bacterium]
MADLAFSEPQTGPDPVLARYARLVERLEARQPVDEAVSRLAGAAVDVWARPGFDTFVSLPRLRFEPFDYQLQAAETVLRRMRGRAILADEVGLGKTIEAGLVLSELRLRGLARHVLVLCPAGLVAQWQEELDRKFALPSVVVAKADAGAESGRPDPPVALASLPSARRSPLREALAEVAWDLVVVDEAHRVKNPSTASARMVRALRTRHMLLLTATPVENRLSDLFNLASLVSPGVLGTAREFRARHGGDTARAPKDLDALRDRMGEVMVRHRRSQVALMLPQRLAETLVLSPLAGEGELYRQVAGRVRGDGRGASAARLMALRSALRLAGSSPAALAGAAAKLGWADLETLARAQESSAKAAALLSVLGRLASGGQKVIVFTAFRRTQEFVAGVLAQAGVDATSYHGSLPRAEKERVVESFRGPVPVLVTTEAAGEGRNLQFCHNMVNFDLPWNPMQIEQRLGRLHRIGQDHDVSVVNLVARGTVEEQILAVLETKINLFELVVGELDMILGHIDDEYDFERFVFDAHVASADHDDFAARLGEFGDRLAEARREYLDSRARNDALVADHPGRCDAG